MRALELPDVLKHDWIGPLSGATTAVPLKLASSWSSMAARLRELEQQFARAEFDQERVEALRRAIAEGRFEVDAAGVAFSMLDSIVHTGRKN
jgi:flagellar biosynthesis anti-sigma factor FlgM